MNVKSDAERGSDVGAETPAKAKRVRRDPAITRALILDVTEQLMLDEGYAAVTTRRVAKVAGLAAGLVHYYYPTTDDLLVAAFRRMNDRNFDSLQPLLDAENPLRSLWDHQTRSTPMALALEFMALANHRKVIGDEIRRSAERARDLQAEAVARVLGEGDPLAVTTLLVSVARTLIMEQAIGISRGHDETRALVADLIANMARGEATGG